MATQLEQERLRMDLGFGATDELSLSNDTIDAIFVEAGEYYTDPASILVGTRVLSLRRLLMQAANEVDYTQNRTSEKASQRYKQLENELLRWEGLLEDVLALSGEGGSVRSGKPTQNPPRVKEYPWGYTW